MKMEAGAAAMNLRRPRLAAQLLAEMGETEQACEIARMAVEAVRVAPSQHTAASLRALRGALVPYRARPEVMELRLLVAEALS